MARPGSKAAAIREIVDENGLTTDTPAKEIVEACAAKYKRLGVTVGDVNQWKMRERSKNGKAPGKRGRKKGSTFPRASNPEPEGSKRAAKYEAHIDKLRLTFELIEAAGGVEEAKSLIDLAGKIAT